MAAPLRITCPATTTATVKSAFGPLSEEGPSPPTVAGSTSTEFQSYMGRLVLLIPGEVISLYLVGIGIIPPDSKIGLIVWAVVCLILVVLVRTCGTGDRADNEPIQWTAVVVSSISFVIWIYVMQGPFQAYGLAIPYVGSLIIMVWTFVVPYFYRGDPRHA